MIAVLLGSLVVYLCCSPYSPGASLTMGSGSGCDPCEESYFNRLDADIHTLYRGCISHSGRYTACWHQEKEKQTINKKSWQYLI